MRTELIALLGSIMRYRLVHSLMTHRQEKDVHLIDKIWLICPELGPSCGYTYRMGHWRESACYRLGSGTSGKTVHLKMSFSLTQKIILSQQTDSICKRAVKKKCLLKRIGIGKSFLALHNSFWNMYRDSRKLPKQLWIDAINLCILGLTQPL